MMLQKRLKKASKQECKERANILAAEYTESFIDKISLLNVDEYSEFAYRILAGMAASSGEGGDKYRADRCVGVRA
jgi:hypothetical protein